MTSSSQGYMNTITLPPTKIDQRAQKVVALTILLWTRSGRLASLTSEIIHSPSSTLQGCDPWVPVYIRTLLTTAGESDATNIVRPRISKSVQRVSTALLYAIFLERETRMYCCRSVVLKLSPRLLSAARSRAHFRVLWHAPFEKKTPP